MMINDNRCLFTGDTVFIGGCGKFFEGDGQDMHRNIEIYKSFPGDASVYPGHDYTESNLRWAMGVEWENPDYEKYLKRIQLGKENKLFREYQIPSSIEQEKKSNIFFRSDNFALREKLGVGSEIDCITKLREMKDKG